MKKIILHRPKSIEKYHDETKYRIFINDQFVGKLKRKETLEVEVEEDMVDIQAKFGYWGSRKERIELTTDLTEINVVRNQKTPYTNSPNAYIPLIVFLVSFTPNFLGWKNVWSQAIIAVFGLVFLFYIIKYYIINRYDWILIKKQS